MRINIYRGQTNTVTGADNADTVPDSADEVPDNANTVPDTNKKMPDSIEGLPDNEQERKIYQYVLENSFITSARTAALLNVKQRRARVVLKDMIEGNYLRKEGAARNTIYVNSTEGK
ncbi:hypothetical protein H6B07_02925 [Mediterraneibacter glycyrrhizinilyticus]|nr:hypothetical protein [Mediterraneibacter glycyrrhizinilyticus]MBM6801631.1 hypothetical protein [Mediterraneibacter glycyrrhizinilyticus]